jgi:hypothetical protein
MRYAAPKYFMISTAVVDATSRAPKPIQMAKTLTTMAACKPARFHIPRVNPYFMPADMLDNAPGPGLTQMMTVAAK